MLAQQASGFDVGGHNFHIQEKPMHQDSNFYYVGAGEPAKPTVSVGLVGQEYLADSQAASVAISPKSASNRFESISDGSGTDLED